MIKILLSGADGQMGKVITAMVEEADNFEITAGFSTKDSGMPYPMYTDLKGVKENVDVLIDFSDPSALKEILNFARENNTPLVLASTGYSKDQEEEIKKLAKNLPIVYSRNMSLGVNVMEKIAKEMARMLEGFDIEIVEKHHKYKKDSPSGTAKMLFEAVNEGRNNSLEELDGRRGFYDERPETEVGISAIRGGNIVGEHSVIFAGQDEVLEISHKASSKKIFANGALKASKFIVDAENGLYTMQDVL